MKISVQASFIEHDHVVQALAAKGADHAFHIGALPGRTRCRKHRPDSHGLHLINEVLPEDVAAPSPSSRLMNASWPAMSPFGHHLTCPLHHVHDLDALNRAHRLPGRPEALTSSHPSFDGAVVLLHDVVQVPDGPATAAPPEFAGLLQLGDHLRI